MFKKIFWINIGLFVIVLLLSYNLYKIWSQVITQIKSPPVQIEVEQKPEDIEQAKDEWPDYTPSSRMSYTPIVEKDLFRPEREEWQPPPPPEEEEVELQQSSPYPQYPGQPPQPEMRKPTLHGVIIIGESKKYAIMQGWTREEQTERTRKIPIGGGQFREVPLPPLPGQIKQDKINAYRIGDYISEAQVVDILPDKVVMEQEDGERYDILLREPAKLETWKNASSEGEMPGGPGAEFGQPGGPPFPPGMQPYPIPQGVPIYPQYIPAYPLPPPPGYIPPGVRIPQGGGGQVPVPPSPPQPQQLPAFKPPGFPTGGATSPLQQGIPGLIKR
ncbi:MAG: hypothetical protein ACMUHX_00485 [bacterium]